MPVYGAFDLADIGKNEKGNISMLNEKVFHKMFGEGVIVKSVDGSKSYLKQITVLFGDTERKFVFPDAFDGFLVAESESLRSEVERATAFALEEKERERILTEAAKARENAERSQRESIRSRKSAHSATNVRAHISDGLIRGKAYGTAAKDIYLSACDAFSWNRSNAGHFGWQTPNYSDIATPEGYSVWFLAHSNWTGTDTHGVINKISESYMEQWWMDKDYPKAGKRPRVIFAKKDGVYLFLGIFVYDGLERVEHRDGKDYYVERFNSVSDKYPE